MEEIHDDTEVQFEVKGRDDHWELWYPNEGNIQTPFQVFDKEGKLKSIIWAGEDAGKELTKSNHEFSTAKEAIKYAKDELGAENIRLVKTKERKKKTD
jgi:hypothetical protein